MFIRWRDPNNTGSDQGLGVDDIRFQAVPEPTTMLLAALALGGGRVLRWALALNGSSCSIESYVLLLLGCD